MSGNSVRKSVRMNGITTSAPTAMRPMLRFSEAISACAVAVASSSAQGAKPTSWNSASVIA